MTRQPRRDMRRRQRRKAKIRYLRKRLMNTREPEARDILITKLRKISRKAPLPEG